MLIWSERPPIARPLRHWLVIGGSLSARLAHAGQGLVVQRLRQRMAPARRDEQPRLGHRSTVLAREVALQAAGKTRVLARSITLHPSRHGPWRALGGLGQRPLADILFGSRSPRRSALEFARIKPGSPEHRALYRALVQTGETPVRLGVLWARRSVFTRDRAPLLVAEVFLPAVIDLPAPGARHWTPARPRR